MTAYSHWVIATALAIAPGVAASQVPPEPRRSRLIEMVRQDCGSCHGLTLKGGLGPALLPASMAGKDAEQMRHVILHGRRGTPMPPWKDFLSEAEGAWIVQMLRQGLPDAR
jgi:cytochrome c55X